METLFGLVSLLPMPIWLSMLLFPRTDFTRRLVSAAWPFLALGGVYAVLLVVSLFVGGGVGSLGFDALRDATSTEWGFLVVWAHMIALDLFAGVWIFRDAKYWDVVPTWFLVATLMAGPLGLAAYLWYRSRRGRSDPVHLLN